MASKGIEVSIIENNIEVELLTSLLDIEIASEPTVEITLDDGAVVEVSLKENAPICTQILQKAIETSEVIGKPINVTFHAVEVIRPTTSNHSLLKNLNYDEAGHLGFQKELISSSVSDETIKAGQVLNLKGTGHVSLAKADSSIASNICGLAKDDGFINNTCRYVNNGSLTMSDWTNVTGSVNLIVGALYYVDTTIAGHLTFIAPSAGGKYVIKVGRASKVNTLDLEIEERILL